VNFVANFNEFHAAESLRS